MPSFLVSRIYIGSFFLQKRIARIIDNKGFQTPLDPCFKNLKVFKIISLGTDIFMFSYCNHLLPSTLYNLFTSASLVHNYNTRFAQNFRPIKSRTTLKPQGPVFWNSLSRHLTSMTRLANSQFPLQCELLSKYAS